MKTEKSTVVLFLLAVVVALASYAAGNADGKRFSNRAAIEAGVAKFVVDEKTGVTKFVYIQPTQ